ncbi:MAG: nucleotidyl transferase AbiEii/AbiGii toxin family protein [Myxococcota bacterium]
MSDAVRQLLCDGPGGGASAILRGMDVPGALEQVVTVLGEAQVQHALIGGLALAAHGAGRATQDIDFLVDGARSSDVHSLMERLGYRALHRSENAANYASDANERGRVDFLFALRPYAKAMLARAESQRLFPSDPLEVRVVDAADLIGLKVQSSSNDASRHRIDMADIVRLLRGGGDVDMQRVREYFRLFEREKELDGLLGELGLS